MGIIPRVMQVFGEVLNRDVTDLMFFKDSVLPVENGLKVGKSEPGRLVSWGGTAIV